MTQEGTFGQGRLSTLLAELDSPQAGVAEDAQAELTALGLNAAPQLVEALATLTPFGKLCAIEILEAWSYAAAAPALTELLADESSTVRQWAAAALGQLGCIEAVPELQRLHSRLRAEDVPPDWIEPVAVRRALRDLGARQQVVPPALARSVEHREHGDVWPAAIIGQLLDQLAEHGQVILGFQLWRQDDGTRLFWQDHASLGWQLDRSTDWKTNVEGAVDAARTEAACLPDDRAGLFVTMEWIDSSDEQDGAG